MDDRFLLPYRDRRVTQIVVDHALTLVLDGDARITIEGTASLSKGPADSPELLCDLAPGAQQVEGALVLFGVRVMSSIAFKSGALTLAFDNAIRLRVPIDGSYEAWSARGPGSLHVVSLPGGQLAVWR